MSSDLRRGATLWVACALALGTFHATPAEEAEAAPPAQVFPIPQETIAKGAAVRLDGTVELMLGTVSESTAELARSIVADTSGTVTANGKVRLIVGTTQDAALVPTGVPIPERAEGYALYTTTVDGVPAIAAIGRDTDGAFYALQSLRQLVTGGAVPGVQIRDWPLMPVRGTVEGFYGAPWTQDERQAVLRFSARHKLNTYMYTPKDDQYLRSQWRDPYPESNLAELRQLAADAQANHVDLVVALSPGNDICYTSDADYAAAVAKFDALQQVGITHFSIALDDIDPARLCTEDQTAFSSGTAEARVAAAQAHFVNRVQRNYLTPRELPALSVTPTSYHGVEADAAKTTFGNKTDADTDVLWTGGGIVDDDITTEEATQAAAAFHREKLLLWDNFPVNDGDVDRLFLGQLPPRAADLHTHLSGVLTNPMLQAHASLPALASSGDYSWNAPTFDAAASHRAALTEIAGPDPSGAIAAFADAVATWEYDGNPEDTQLATDVKAYNKALAAGEPAQLTAARNRLRDRLTKLTQAPTALKTGNPEFASDVAPWSQAAAHWAKAGLAAIAVHDAIAQGAEAPATSALQRMNQADIAATTPVGGVVPRVGDGWLTALVSSAEKAWEAKFNRQAPEPTGLPVRPSTTLGQQDSFGLDKAIDGDLTTAWKSTMSANPGTGLTIDLGSEQSPRQITLQQGGDGAESLDYFHNGRLEISSDGYEWTTLGTANTPTVTKAVPAGSRVRFVRLINDAPNPDHQWVQVREIAIS
ncbi:MAG: beta-N-acetylglucosaminidase domain-containing protein [Propionibacteriaceae bacterium]|nr:beta-N-acetylglucosaminidase domain-containing protein [Propionibacteriaceae bacterium]